MSGYPNMPQIDELRAALHEIAIENDKIAKAEKDAAFANLCIDQATQRRGKHMRKVHELIESMDCSRTGNAGWENRIIALLTGLSTAAEQHGRDHR